MPLPWDGMSKVLSQRRYHLLCGTTMDDVDLLLNYKRLRPKARRLHHYLPALGERRQLNVDSLCGVNFNLMELPLMYTDLYMATREYPCMRCRKKDAKAQPALCLLCGGVMCIEPDRNRRACFLERESERSRSVGSCTLHSMVNHGGIGVYYLIHDNKIVLVKGRMAAFYPTLYVDANGEDVARVSTGKHRPLYLERSRWEALAQLVQSHLIGHVVSSLRSSSDGWIPMELI